ncbi:hypothetical protein DPSP01_012143 [Paraphaeosphaeria sporulosa]
MNKNLEKVFRKTVERENRGTGRPKAPSIVPDIDPPVNPPDNAIQAARALAPPDDDSDHDKFEDLVWERVAHLQKRFTQHLRGKPSWIYDHG